jgi:probable rRNA maturation factor
MPVSEASTDTRVDVQFEVEPDIHADWDRPRIEQLVRSIVRRELPPGHYSISLYLVGDETLRALNRDHRGLDQHTDVLSFPLHDPTGMQFVLPPDHVTNLGDVVIAYPRVLAQAEAYGHSPERELAYLTTHGVLHVLGYDHEQELERRRMRAREEEALAPLGFTR